MNQLRMSLLNMSLLQMSLSAAGMIFVITVIRAIAINRLPKSTFAVLWGITLARLLVPFSFPSPFSVYSLLNRLGTGSIGGILTAKGLPFIPVSSGAPGIPAPMGVPGAPGIPLSSAVPAPPAITAFPTFAFPAPGASLWTWIWIIGLILCALYFIIAYIRCRRKFMNSRPVENAFTVQWLTNHRCKRPVTIRQTGGISAPLTYGLLQPVILMPDGTDWTDTKELQYVLTHEYVHIRRMDGVTKLSLTAALCIHWFNPMVWVMYILANRDIELSCDEKVVRTFGETIKSAYALALIDMEEKKSGLTPLCSHFSKNAIEERIEAIMKIRKTTVFSLVTACAVVITVGSTFATSAAPKSTPDQAKDRSTKQTEAEAPFAYKFQPDPQIYSQYSSYGITVSEDGEILLYNGRRVRLFVDEHSDTEAFFADEAGTLDLSVMRNAAGNITGIETISGRKAQEYREAFFAGDTLSNVEVMENAQATVYETVNETVHETVNDTVNGTVQDTTGKYKFDQYSAYGITLSSDGNVLYHNDRRVKLLVDELADGNFETFWTDEAGTDRLAVARDSKGRITDIKSISEDQAQKYHERIKSLFPMAH